jgi:hypothetical protein
MIKRIFHLNTTVDDKKTAIHTLFRCLVAQGYRPDTIRPIFHDAICCASAKNTTPTKPVWFETQIFLHLLFNLKDVPSKCLQRIFLSTLLQPPGEPTLPNMENHFEAPISTTNRIVVGIGPHNLKNLLFPRGFSTRFDCLPSLIFSELSPG